MLPRREIYKKKRDLSLDLVAYDEARIDELMNKETKSSFPLGFSNGLGG